MQKQPPGLVTRTAVFFDWVAGETHPQGCGAPATHAGGSGAGGAGAQRALP